MMVCPYDEKRLLVILQVAHRWSRMQIISIVIWWGD